MSDETQPRRLPVWRTVKASYLVLFKNAGLALLLVSIPFILSALSDVYSIYFAGDVTTDKFLIVVQTITMQHPIAVFLNVIAYLASIPTVTAWHRLVLRGRRTADSGPSYTVKRAEWIYLGKLVLYCLILLLALLPVSAVIIGLIAKLPEHSILRFVDFALQILIWAFFIGMIFRLSLVFPATAIGEPFTFKASWQRTRNNTWRLIFVPILCMIPIVLIQLIVFLSFFGTITLDTASSTPSFDVVQTFTGSHAIGLQVFGAFLGALLWVVSLCVLTSVWSWAYRYLIQGEDIILSGEREQSETAPQT